jgi:hypothetical protein
MVESIELYRRFEQLVAEIFRAEKFEVQVSPIAGTFEVDLFLKSHTGRTAIVECKLYRTRQLSAGTLRRIVTQLEMYRRQYEADRAVLVTAARIPHASRVALTEENPRLVFFDLDALKFIVLSHPRLGSQLEEILREVFIVPAPLDGDEDRTVATTAILNAPIDEIPERPSEPLEITKGEQLCSDIREVKKGRLGARKFEATIEAALKYIFEADLTAWSSQKVTDAGLSRYDLIARVSSENDVWRMLRERFESQYVIFECKNYAEKVR